MAYADSSIWIVSAGLDAVQRLDPVNRTLTTNVPLGFNPTGLVFAGGALWV